MMRVIALVALIASVNGGHWEEWFVCSKECGSFENICVPDSPSENPAICEDVSDKREKVYNSWEEVEERRNGTITLKIAGIKRRVPIIVTSDGKTLLVIQRRIDGSVDFYRNWNDYVKGFGDPKGEYWIGLETLHHLTSNKRSLYVFLEDFKNTKVYALYDTFTVAGPEDRYKLQIGGYSGNAGDAMARQNGMYFSTFDQKNDKGGAQNCAVLFHGAWWYNECHDSNLNGRYFRAPGYHSSFADGVNWRQFRDYHDSMKSSIMALY